MARVAMAHAAGIALSLRGVTPSWTLLLPALPFALILLFRRPWPLGALAAAFLAGVAAGASLEDGAARDCRLHLPAAWETEVEGRFVTRPLPGRSLPFRIESGAPGNCLAVVRASVARGAAVPPAGGRIRGVVRWEGRAFPGPGRAEWAGRLLVLEGWEAAPGGDLRGRLLHLRGRVQDRIVELWGAEAAPMVEALVLARREHLDPDLREAFALSGTAHLLAISGFHVGVVAGLLLGLFRALRLRPRRAEAGAVLGCWLYVLGIGAPPAAVRAALLLTLLLAGRLRGRPVVPAGALGTALLLLLVLDPGWLTSVGFQLSFAGTGGIILLREPIGRGLEQGWGRLAGRPLPRRRAREAPGRLLRGSADGVAAGLAATVPTLPFLAWHFDRVSLLSVPATLMVAPLVASAIPGVGASLLLSGLSMPLGAFLAGGTGLLLDGGARLVAWFAHLPGASVWVSRGALVSALAAGGAVHLLLRIRFPGRIRPRVRRIAVTAGGSVPVLLLPLLPAGGSLELHMIDVGQGDAVALRLPSDRWVLVDTGPRGPGYDAGARRVVPYLRRNGVGTLEAVVLTHPHLDHIGGAPAVFEHLRVRGILDPSRPVGSRPYLEVMEEARDRGISWWPAMEGLAFRADGVRFRVLHPDVPTLTAPRVDDPNDLSVILLVEWREAALLLTGDAPAAAERRILDLLPELSVLKVGHHGSLTSTDPELLERTRPAKAVIPVGDGNRFGHPHPRVNARLLGAGLTVLRTDRDGDIRLVVAPDGSVRYRVDP